MRSGATRSSRGSPRSGRRLSPRSSFSRCVEGLPRRRCLLLRPYCALILHRSCPITGRYALSAPRLPSLVLRLWRGRAPSGSSLAHTSCASKSSKTGVATEHARGLAARGAPWSAFFSPEMRAGSFRETFGGRRRNFNKTTPPTRGGSSAPPSRTYVRPVRPAFWSAGLQFSYAGRSES